MSKGIVGFMADDSNRLLRKCFC